MTRPMPTASPRTFRSTRANTVCSAPPKWRADVMVQEYGRYFGMNTCCLRGGCLTGPNHSGVELHGFLSYLIKCNVEGRTLQGFRLQRQTGSRQHPLAGRGALHPRALSRARAAAKSITSAAAAPTASPSSKPSTAPPRCSGKKMNYEYVDQNRAGDHICYISDLTKMKAHYPGWDITKNLTTSSRKSTRRQSRASNSEHRM